MSETTDFLNEIVVTYKPVKLNIGKIACARSVASATRRLIGEGEIYWKEFFYVFYCNNKNDIISFKRISEGGRSSTLADLKIIFAYACKVGAQGLICIHNHPSGGLEPSANDLRLHERMKKAAELLDMNVIDSLIIAPEKGYYSIVCETAFPNL